MALALKYKGLEAVKGDQEKPYTDIISFEELSKSQTDRRINSILNSEELLDNQRELLFKFNKHLTNRVSLQTIKTYLQNLKKFCIFIKKPLENATKEDIEEFTYHLKQKQHLEDLSIFNHQLVLLKFYRDFLKKKEVVEDIELRKARSKLPIVLMDEEVLKLIQVCDNFRDKALVSMLADLGVRRNELLSLRIKHIQFDKYGAIVTLPYSKTKERRIRLTFSICDLQNWMNAHPTRDDLDSPLFINLGSLKNRALGEDGLKRVIKIATKRANIGKRVYAHLLRHYAITRKVKQGFNEAELRIFAGWSKSSRMPEIYTHISDMDLNKKILALEGKLEEKDKQEDILKPKKCPRCSEVNPAVNKFCSKCSMVLDLKTAVDLENEGQNDLRVMREMLLILAQTIAEKIPSEAEKITEKIKSLKEKS